MASFAMASHVLISRPTPMRGVCRRVGLRSTGMAAPRARPALCLCEYGCCALDSGRHCYVSSRFLAPMNATELADVINFTESDHVVALNQCKVGTDATLYEQEQITLHEQDQLAPQHVLCKPFQQFALCVLVGMACCLLPQAAHAVAENSIGASSLGLKVAELLRGSGFSDELVVFIVAMMPVVELRGAIPISYWLKVDPIKGYILSVLGNMAPVPFIVLYLEKVAKSVGEGSETGRRFVNWLFERTRRKAGPIEEFRWLGLLLFVAVPLPGTGAWTGAIAASILGMPFMDAITANFLGVLLAGLLVNLFVSIGAKEACLVGALLFGCSFFMWGVLRMIQQKKNSSPVK